MPLTVQSTSGTSFHLFQLRTSIKDYSEEHFLTTLENDLSDGYESSILFGSAAGLKRFRFTLPTITDSPTSTVVDINSATVTKRAYMRSLFHTSKMTGRPFVFQSIENGQYYLVKFADQSLTLERMFNKLTSTGIELKQVRVEGESVFNPAALSGLTVWNDHTTHSGANWNNKVSGMGTTGQWTGSGDVLSPTVDGRTIKRLNSVSNTGKLSTTITTTLINDAVFVMKVREPLFGQTSGILGTQVEIVTGGNQYIRGVSGDDVISPQLSLASNSGGFNLAFINGSPTAQYSTGATIPMNAVMILYLTGANGSIIAQNLENLVQMGQTYLGASTKAEIDLHEQMFFTGYNTLDTILELSEHLAISWS